MATSNLPESEVLFIKKSELIEIIKEIDRIGLLLDFLLEKQAARSDLMELLPHRDYADQDFLKSQRIQRKRGDQ